MQANLTTINQIPKIEIAHMALANYSKPKQPIYIDAINVYGKKVEVTYINEAVLNSGIYSDDDWTVTEIKLETLKKFCLDKGKNKVTFDFTTWGGVHAQEECTISIEHFLSENLTEVVKTYLEA